DPEFALVVSEFALLTSSEFALLTSSEFALVGCSGLSSWYPSNSYTLCRPEFLVLVISLHFRRFSSAVITVFRDNPVKFSSREIEGKHLPVPLRANLLSAANIVMPLGPISEAWVQTTFGSRE